MNRYKYLPESLDWFITYPKVQSWRRTLFQIKTSLPTTEFIVIGKEDYKTPQKGHTKHIHVFLRFEKPEKLPYNGPIATVAGIHGNVKQVTHDPHKVLCYVTKSQKVIGYHRDGKEMWKHLRLMIGHWRQQWQMKQKGEILHVTGDAFKSPEDHLPESPLAQPYALAKTNALLQNTMWLIRKPE